MKWHLDDEGYSLIKGFEGLRLFAYQDVAGVWTIGYGSTRYEDGSRVKKGDTLHSKAEADALFAHTLADYEETVNTLVKVDLTQEQYNSLVSFTYNEGTGALAVSHLLKFLNCGDYKNAGSQFSLWNKVTDPQTGQKVANADLTKRRQIESEPFLNAA